PFRVSLFLEILTSEIMPKIIAIGQKSKFKIGIKNRQPKTRLAIAIPNVFFSVSDIRPPFLKIDIIL
ncbi:MAG: hypothetical protein KAI91_05180, partial [Candidatus Omnitrophica bacterium]|nr:hypothetical protein [Candidatus Omnitrophota bacterium]